MEAVFCLICDGIAKVKHNLEDLFSKIFAVILMKAIEVPVPTDNISDENKAFIKQHTVFLRTIYEAVEVFGIRFLTTENNIKLFGPLLEFLQKHI